jgi:hypothetical protein
VAACEVDRESDRPVERRAGLDHQPRVVLVRHLVDALFLDQDEEAVAILGQDVERLGRHIGQRHDGVVDVAVALLAMLEHLLVGEQPQQLGPAGALQLGGVRDVAVAELLRSLDEVAAIALALLARVGRRVVGVGARVPGRIPVVLAAADDHVRL